MRSILCFFFCFVVFNISHAHPFEEVPIFYQGRFRPAEAQKARPIDELLLMPSKQNSSLWLPLSTLNIRQNNFSAYSDPAFEKIKNSYFNDRENLPQALVEAYKEIAGQPYLSSAKRSLHFPSVNQIRAEFVYLHYPWEAVAIVCFGIALLLLPFWNFGYLSFVRLGFLFLTLILGLRIYVLERPPVSNMAETLLFVPWLALAFSLLDRKDLLPASAVLSISLLSLALYLGIHDSLENVQAVLDSNYWLTVHVLLVVGSYGLFLLAGILGHAYLFLLGRKSQITAARLANAIRIASYSGLAMLIPGTILGGIWAAQSWGRFWDWDPKESWAFITICSYLIGVHAYRYRLIGDFGFACFSIVGAWIVTFTWYGVNYILGTGLHSYGFGSGGQGIYFVILAGDAIIFTLLVTYVIIKGRITVRT